MRKLRMGWLVGVLAVVPWAAQAQQWETIATGSITIKARTRPNSPVRDVWAEGDLNASVQDIQSVILDAEGYPRFMPYVKESKYVGKPEPDGSRLVYTRLEPPVVASRDYVVRVLVDSLVHPDGSGVFVNRWQAVPDKVPNKPNVIRLRINEGSWVVIPAGPGKSHVIYRNTVDPGGWMPPFIANMANRNGVTDTFKAVQKEAQRRANQRKEQAHTP